MSEQINQAKGEREAFEALFHRFDLRPSIMVGHYSDLKVQFMWEAWQARADMAVRAKPIEVAALTDETLKAAYWDFDARKKGYAPYGVPYGSEEHAFVVAVRAALTADPKETRAEKIVRLSRAAMAPIAEEQARALAEYMASQERAE